MHIPDSILHGAICPVTAGLSLLGVAAAAVSAANSTKKPQASRFAGVAALIFAGQMLNFPIAGGTSGHLLGAVLATVLLGPSFAVLAMTLVLAVQALFFADGGLLALGANILNMALLGVGVGALLQSLFKRRADLKTPVRALLIAAGSWLAVMLAALAVSGELAVSGAGSLATVTGAMLGSHAWIGLGEGLLSAALYLALAPRFQRAAPTGRRDRTLPLAVAALLFSPWASHLPDGLEQAATRLGLLNGGITLFAPLAGYRLPVLGQPQLTLILAGTCGALLVFGLAWMLASRLQGHAAAGSI